MTSIPQPVVSLTREAFLLARDLAGVQSTRGAGQDRRRRLRVQVPGPIRQAAREHPEATGSASWWPILVSSDLIAP